MHLLLSTQNGAIVEARQTRMLLTPDQARGHTFPSWVLQALSTKEALIPVISQVICWNSGQSYRSAAACNIPRRDLSLMLCISLPQKAPRLQITFLDNAKSHSLKNDSKCQGCTPRVYCLAAPSWNCIILAWPTVPPLVLRVLSPRPHSFP